MASAEAAAGAQRYAARLREFSEQLGTSAPADSKTEAATEDANPEANANVEDECGVASAEAEVEPEAEIAEEFASAADHNSCADTGSESASATAAAKPTQPTALIQPSDSAHFVDPLSDSNVDSRCVKPQKKQIGDGDVLGQMLSEINEAVSARGVAGVSEKVPLEKPIELLSQMFKLSDKELAQLLRTTLGRRPGLRDPLERALAVIDTNGDAVSGAVEGVKVAAPPWTWLHEYAQTDWDADASNVERNVGEADGYSATGAEEAMEASTEERPSDVGPSDCEPVELVEPKTYQ